LLAVYLPARAHQLARELLLLDALPPRRRKR